MKIYLIIFIILLLNGCSARTGIGRQSVEKNSYDLIIKKEDSKMIKKEYDYQEKTNLYKKPYNI